MFSLSVKKLIQTNYSTILVNNFSKSCSLKRKKKNNTESFDHQLFSFPFNHKIIKKRAMQNYEYFLVLDFEATCDQEKPPQPQVS